MEFERDPQKAARNLQWHGVSFAEAATVFADPLSVTVADPDHSTAEDRFLIVGQSYRGRLLIVSFAEHGKHIRIIRVRELTRAERRAYEEETHE